MSGSNCCVCHRTAASGAADKVELGPGQRVFVTGGSGFVGRALIAALKARGCAVAALVRSERSAEVIRSLGAEPVKGDLSDAASLEAGMRGSALAFHLAAATNEWGPRESFYGPNVAGTRNMLTAARSASVRRFVHMSSEAVLAGGRPVIDADETAAYPAHPVGLYPETKRLAEQAVLGANTGSFETVVVRPRAVWGKGDTLLLPPLAAAMRGRRWVWWGPARHLSSFCHVANLVEGTLLAAQRGRPGEIYFLTDGPPAPMRQFLEELVRTQGVAPFGWPLPKWLGWQLGRLGELVWGTLGLPGQPPIERTTMNLMFEQMTVVDAKARRELGYQARMTRQAGMQELREEAQKGKK